MYLCSLRQKRSSIANVVRKLKNMAQWHIRLLFRRPASESSCTANLIDTGIPAVRWVSSSEIVVKMPSLLYDDLDET